MRNTALRFAWGLNLVMLGCVFVAALLVDGNGRILGVGQPYSNALVLTLFVLGTMSALVVLIFFPKPTDRVVGGLSLIMYLILAIPGLF